MKKYAEKFLEFVGIAMIVGFGSTILYWGFKFLAYAFEVIIK